METKFVPLDRNMFPLVLAAEGYVAVDQAGVPVPADCKIWPDVPSPSWLMLLVVGA